jgi:hypothetical protein
MSSQSILRLHTGAPDFQPSQWRHHFISSALGTQSDWDRVAIIQSGTALSFLARQPEANDWIQAQSADLVRSVANKIGRVAPFEYQDIEVSMRPDESVAMWTYRIPKLVVAKERAAWDRLKSQALDDQAAEEIRARIARDLNAYLVRWGAMDATAPAVQVTLVDAGRPMPITAITAERSGHGRHISVLARLDVVFKTDWRIQGAIQVGMLPGLGFGRAFRDERVFESNP